MTASSRMQTAFKQMRGEMRFGRHELAGAFADIGVLVPIATALIIKNGLSATAVLLPAALLYLIGAAVYRLPMPVQPLKAFGAIAIAKGLGSDEIAAGAMIMGVVFLVLGRAGLIDAAARLFPRPLIRGVQLTVGLLFLKIAWGLVADAPKSFVDHTAEPTTLVVLALVVLAAAFALRKRSVSLVLVSVAIVVALVRAGDELAFGPSAIALPGFDAATFWTAFTVLALPQIPLTFANSTVATSDAARTYFGARAANVRPGRLATTLGVANIFSGAIGGMPVCHGAGGLTAHYSFGARTAGAPVAIGMTLLVLAVGLGASLAAVLAAFPLAILAGMLGAAGVLHIGLLRDLRGVREWSLALIVGAIGFAFNLAPALAVGLMLWWLPTVARRVRGATFGRLSPQRSA
ncbi:MAG: hypothetical protein HY827_10200 [Actinobacteria bacterium]|nr:hypothetical protein [Actinomycetota bacterium]